MKFTGIPGIPGEGELYFEHKFRWPAPWEEGRRRGEEVTTALTCRSSRILVSSFGRAARSKAGTGSTFARQSEKRAKYGRKRGAPFLLPTPLLFPSPHSTPLLPSLSAVSNEEMPGGDLSIRNVSSSFASDPRNLEILTFRNSIRFLLSSFLEILLLFQKLIDSYC